MQGAGSWLIVSACASRMIAPGVRKGKKARRAARVGGLLRQAAEVNPRSEEKMRPRFSLITPVLNGEDYIARSYWCLRNQSIHDWEWIIVDDGSEDRTASEVTRLGDERIKFVRLDANRGRGFARTAAINESCGEWIVVWDIDDIYFPDRLVQAAEAMEQGKDFCVSGCVVIDRLFRLTGQRGFGLFDDGETRSFLHPSLSGNREKIKGIGYEASYTIGEDFLLIYKLSREFNGFWSADPVIAYREDSNPNKVKEAVLSKVNQVKDLQRIAAEGTSCAGVRRAIRRAVMKKWLLTLLLGYPPLYKLVFPFRSHGVESAENVLSRAKLEYLREARQRLADNCWT